jgi:hypothetical protein
MTGDKDYNVDLFSVHAPLSSGYGRLDLDHQAVIPTVDCDSPPSIRRTRPRKTGIVPGSKVEVRSFVHASFVAP